MNVIKDSVKGKYNTYRIEILEISDYGCDSLKIVIKRGRLKSKVKILSVLNSLFKYKTLAVYEFDSACPTYEEYVNDLIKCATVCVTNYENSIEEETTDMESKAYSIVKFNRWDGKL